MADVTLEAPISATADTVWALVGRFGDLDEWHPWVPNCSLSDDGLTRTIDLGAMSAIEVLDPSRTTSHGHSYTVTKSPMPIRDYRATWSVVDGDGGCTLKIHAAFEPVGDEAQAVAMIRGFFDTAITTLQKRFAT